MSPCVFIRELGGGHSKESRVKNKNNQLHCPFTLSDIEHFNFQEALRGAAQISGSELNPSQSLPFTIPGLTKSRNSCLASGAPRWTGGS